jgi:hypothetical protein
MRTFILHYGYGYSKLLCEDITSWFLNQFLSRYKIHVEILHRGMNRENTLGTCDFIENSYRPRHFLIEMNTYMKKDLYTKILLHELTHLKQWVTGSLRFRQGKVWYYEELIEDYEYENQPHEIDAREQENLLYEKYLMRCADLNCVH